MSATSPNNRRLPTGEPMLVITETADPFGMAMLVAVVDKTDVPGAR